MGGPGSGRWPVDYTRRSIVESCVDLSITDMTRKGVLLRQIEIGGSLDWTDKETQKVDFTIKFQVIWHSADGALLRLAYKLPDTAEMVRYSIQVASTQPHWGGARFWFLCPISGTEGPCGRRAGKLYLPPQCKYFGCRLCYQLSYRSVHRYEQRAALTRLDRLRGES